MNWPTGELADANVATGKGEEADHWEEREKCGGSGAKKAECDDVARLGTCDIFSK